MKPNDKKRSCQRAFFYTNATYGKYGLYVPVPPSGLEPLFGP
jgi:hypothetical protein